MKLPFVTNVITILLTIYLLCCTLVPATYLFYNLKLVFLIPFACFADALSFYKWSSTSLLSVFMNFFYLFAHLKIYFFIWGRKSEHRCKRQQEQGEGQRKKENQTLPWAGTLVCGSIPRPYVHDLNERQTLKWLRHSGALFICF